MTEEVLALIIKLRDEASGVAEQLKGNLSGLGDTMKGVGMVAGGAALAGVLALGAGIAGGLEDAKNSRMLMAATEQTIATMGNAAGVSAQHVADMAAALSDASGASLFGDDQIQQSTNLLLTFGEIKGATLDAATALTVDLAQALGGEPKDQAMMLGKALNDPINGISALGKAGLTFSDEQKAMIESLVETGDMAGAQAIIIEELNKQVGGQGKAAADAAGGMVVFQAGLGETFETIATELLPILDELGKWLASPEVQAAIQEFATSLASGIRIAADFTVHQLMPAIRDLYNFLAPILGPAIAELGRALSEDLPRGVAIVVAAWIGMQQALDGFYTDYVAPVIRGFEYASSVVSDLQRQFDGFISGLQSAVIPDWLEGHSPPPLANWFSDIAGAASDADQAIPTLGGSVALPALSPAAAGGPGSTNGAAGRGGPVIIVERIEIIVTEALPNMRALALELRDELNRIGVENAGSVGFVGI